ncbi:hypothetical protein [Gemmata massiliana]|nr:hypothetical protein [Gemmata massiliana]
MRRFTSVRPPFFHHLGANGFQRGRAEIFRESVAVQGLQNPERLPVFGNFLGGCAVGTAVVLFGVAPKSEKNLVNGRFEGTGNGTGHNRAGSNFRDDATVLGPALGGIVNAQVHVATLAGDGSDRDDGLSGWFVEPIGRDGNRARHAKTLLR